MSVTLPVVEGKAFVVMWITQQRIPTARRSHPQKWMMRPRLQKMEIEEEMVLPSDRKRPRSDGHVLGGSVLAVNILNSTRYGGFGNNVGGGGLERGGGLNQKAAVGIPVRSERGKHSEGSRRGSGSSWRLAQREVGGTSRNTRLVL